MRKLILACIGLLLLSASCIVDAGVQGIPGSDQLNGVVMGNAYGETTSEKAAFAAKSLLSTAKVIINGLAIIYIVYVGVMMIIAYGDDGELAKQKKQIMYTLVAFLFVNIPGQLYNVFTAWWEQNRSITWWQTNSNFIAQKVTGRNLFANFDVWYAVGNNGILAFIRVAIIGIAVFMFALAGIRLISSGGNEEAAKKAKSQFLWGVLSLLFLGVIHAYAAIVYSGDIPKGQSVVATIANFALFFAGPVAIFFLMLGAWYYITSAGDEEKAKKGKSIVINTFIAVIILLASYTFLKDLADFSL